jgi:hypothetical protein
MVRAQTLPGPRYSKYGSMPLDGDGEGANCLATCSGVRSSCDSLQYAVLRRRFASSKVTGDGGIWGLCIVLLLGRLDVDVQWVAIDTLDIKKHLMALGIASIDMDISVRVFRLKTFDKFCDGHSLSPRLYPHTRQVSFSRSVPNQWR